MAQEKLVTVTVDDKRELILPSRNEILAQKMRKFHEENRQKNEEKIYRSSLDEFCRHFTGYAHEFFGFSYKQLSCLSVQDLEMLSRYIERCVFPWVVVQVAVFLLIPGIGWFWYLVANSEDESLGWFYSYRYFHWLRKIKKIRGKDYFPGEELHAYLQVIHNDTRNKED